jgi:asparagine synthase (glutamine-hydrolysing)
VSGLAALLRRDGAPVDINAVQLMLDAAQHRGPDGSRLWSSVRVGLGHAKLAVTPEDERESQPLVSPRTGCVVVADVRLDNRAELLASLGGGLGPGPGDAEILLQAYDAWGIDAAKRLLGDFAFVIWDPRHERLVCARDTSGQRSLYYRMDERMFAAASEIQQLLQDPEFPVEPNDDRIREALAPINMVRNEQQTMATFYRGVWSVLPGHLLVVERGSIRRFPYWQFEPKELRYKKDEEYAEHYKDLLFEVLRSRLRGARKVGVLLSGGLDSSSILCVGEEIARSSRATTPELVGFTSVFPDLDCDERPYVEEIRAKYGVDVRYIPSGRFGGRLDPEPRGFLERPNMGVAEMREAMFTAVSDAGVRSVLSGDVADSFVGGSRLIFDALLRRGSVAAFLRYVQSYRRLSADSLRKIVVLYSLVPLLPISLQRRVMSANVRRLWRSQGKLIVPRWMPEGLREELSQLHLRFSLEAEARRRFTSPAREGEFRLLYDSPELAWQAVGWPIELGRPFADRRLHEFLLAVPPERKIGSLDQGWYSAKKRLPREAMRGILPERIRTRTAPTEFGSGLRAEIESQWPNYERVFGPGGSPEVAARGYVIRSAIWARLQEVRMGAPAPDLAYLMHVTGLETWLRALRLPRPQGVRIPFGPQSARRVPTSATPLAWSSPGE